MCPTILTVMGGGGGVIGGRGLAKTGTMRPPSTWKKKSEFHEISEFFDNFIDSVNSVNSAYFYMNFEIFLI